MLTNALEVLGGLLIVAGVAFIFWPAALIVAGLMVLVAAWQAEQ